MVSRSARIAAWWFLYGSETGGDADLMRLTVKRLKRVLSWLQCLWTSRVLCMDLRSGLWTWLYHHWMDWVWREMCRVRYIIEKFDDCGIYEGARQNRICSSFRLCERTYELFRSPSAVIPRSPYDLAMLLVVVVRPCNVGGGASSSSWTVNPAVEWKPGVERVCEIG